METKNLTHWKKLINPDYLGAYSIEKNKSLILTISDVRREMVKGTGGKNQECTVASFKEEQKPMILNRTNCKIIQKIYGTPYIEEWKNKQIEIYATNVDAFGDNVEALRIKQIVPSISKPILEDDFVKYENAIKSLKDGKTTLDAIKKHYDIRNEVEFLNKTK